MNNKYPLLARMGIINAEEISRFSLQNNNDIDVLRIVYKRQKGSLLPTSKKFRFTRSKKMVVADGGSNKTEILSEISHNLEMVVEELTEIVSAKHNREEQKEVILDEIQRLEEETNTRIAYLRSLVSDLS